MESRCEYNFLIRRVMSMTYTTDSKKVYNVASKGDKLEVIATRFKPADESPHDAIVGMEVSPEKVITLDGTPKNVIVINDQFPGPTIEVMEGAQVR